MVPLGSARRSNRHRLIPDCHVLWGAYPKQANGKAYFRHSVFRRTIRFPRVHHFTNQVACVPRATGLQLRDVCLLSAVGEILAGQKEIIVKKNQSFTQRIENA